MEELATGVPVVARGLPVVREVFGSTVQYGNNAASLAAALAAVAAVVVNRIDHDPALGRNLARSHPWARAAKAHVVLDETPSDERPAVRYTRIS